jgi:cytochrome c553
MSSMTGRLPTLARVAVAALAMLALGAPYAQTVPDAASRQAAVKLAENLCATCHGAQGRGDNPRIPRLAAQQRAYIEVQLKAFRSQSRNDPAAHEYMWGIASTLNDDIVAALAEYFSAQAPAASSAPTDAKLAATGKQLFEQGSPDRGAPPCTGCHGLNAEGMAVFPRLAGQHSEYLYIQLKLIQNKLRESPVMHGLIKQLRGDEMTAVATYLQSR